MTRHEQGYVKDNNHPAYNLINKPNSYCAGMDFFEQIIANILLFGNGYICGLRDKSGSIKQLHLLNPKQTSIEVYNNKVAGYKYVASGGSKIYPFSDVLHIKNYNPKNNLYGMPAIEAAKIPLNIHNAALKWNHSLLSNGARPSGALVMRDSNDYLSEEQFDRLKQQLAEKFSGSENSGKPMLLEGGLDWREMSISPKDMDFIEAKNSAAREIALAFGVPPQLLGINGDNTYSNMQEARLALWEETLIPMLEKVTDALTSWLADNYYEDIKITFDRDNISALASKRENLWAKLTSCDFMTVNEKRELVGLKPLGNKDSLEDK